MKGSKKMNFGTSAELIEVGKVLVEWGFWIAVYGVATMAIGASLIIIGKIFFEDQTDLLLATIAYHLGNK